MLRYDNTPEAMLSYRGVITWVEACYHTEVRYHIPPPYVIVLRHDNVGWRYDNVLGYVNIPGGMITHQDDNIPEV